MEDIIVIGAGPSGLMAAIQASYLGASVTVLEHNDRPLKKLYATGNGRCNFSNLYMVMQYYCPAKQPMDMLRQKVLHSAFENLHSQSARLDLLPAISAVL